VLLSTHNIGEFAMKLRSKFSFSLAALLSSILALVALTGGVASATSLGDLCSDSDNACANALKNNWNAGNNVIAMGSNEKLYTAADNACKGGSLVKSTCPFTASELNKKFKGHPIVKIHWATHSTCLGVSSKNVVESASCQSGNDALWIEAGNVKAGDGIFINVYASNKSDKEMVLTAPTSVGVKLTVGKYTTSNTAQEWEFESKPPTTVLLSESGNGGAQTQTFDATNNWWITYTFDCTDFGQAGNFIININNSNGSLNYDSGANDLELTGGNTDYYSDAGNHYLQINSECNWTVQVEDN
jgi:hypothetical protein